MKEIFIAGTRTWNIGQGDPLLIVHGGPGLDHDYLVKWLEPLRKLRTLVFYDQVGCGDDAMSPEKVDASKVVEQFDRVLDALIREGEVDVLAHSWGAYPVYEALIARHRPHLRKLILVSPVGLTRERFDESGSRLVARIPPEVMAKLEHSGETQLGGPEVMSLLAPYYQADSNHPAPMHFRAYNADTFNRITDTLGNYDCRGIVGHLPRNVLRIYGDRDIEVPDDTREIAAETTLATIKSSGHFSFAERPGDFIERVSTFLAEP